MRYDSNNLPRAGGHSNLYNNFGGSTLSLARGAKNSYQSQEVAAVGLETATLFAEAFNLNQSSPGSLYESSQQLYSPKRKRSRLSINLVRRISSLFSGGRRLSPELEYGYYSPPSSTYGYCGQYGYTRHNSMYAGTSGASTPAPSRSHSDRGTKVSRRQILSSLKEGVREEVVEEDVERSIVQELAPVHRFSRAMLLKTISQQEEDFEPEKESGVRFHVGPDSASDSEGDLPMLSREESMEVRCEIVNEKDSKVTNDNDVYSIVHKRPLDISYNNNEIQARDETKPSLSPPEIKIESNSSEPSSDNAKVPTLEAPQAESEQNNATTNSESSLEGVESRTYNESKSIESSTPSLLSAFYDDKQTVYNRSKSAPELGAANVELTDLNWVATLGVGGFGRVELVTAGDNNNESFALKKMKKSDIGDSKQQQHILNEKLIMEDCESPFIVRLYKTFKDRKYLYMLMEPCLGGELWTILRNHTRFEDDTAKFYTACVIEAFDYLHTKKVIYRDLKPENILLDSSGYVKIVDFGFAKQLGSEGCAWTFCGTPEYVAPEIITNKSHDHRADIWSLGILMYELLTGRPPFTNRPDKGQVYPLILKGMKGVTFPRLLSSSSVELIRQLCRLSPNQRPSLKMARHYMWFAEFDWTSLRNRTMKPPIIPNIKSQADASNFDIYSQEVGDAKEDHSDWDKDF